MILAVADANEVHGEVAGGVYVPGGVAYVHDALEGRVAVLHLLDGLLEDFFAGVLIVGSADPKAFGGDAYVLHFDLGRFFPATGGYGDEVGGVFQELGYSPGGAGYFVKVVGILQALLAEALAVDAFEVGDFGAGYRALEMLLDEVGENGGVTHVGVLAPVDGGEGAVVEVGVGLGKAAAVSAFGVDEGAVDVEEDEGFHGLESLCGKSIGNTKATIIAARMTQIKRIYADFASPAAKFFSHEGTKARRHKGTKALE